MDFFMRGMRPLLVLFMLAPLPHAASAQDADAGRAIAEERCARCHAIDKTGQSPHAEAPAFRDLQLRYPVENLEEALAEGILTGHAEMPEFVLEPEQIGDFIAYLKSLNEKGG